MQFRKIVLGICLLFPVTVFASDALIDAAVYQCNADEVNQAVANACSDTYPALSADASEALFKWRGRNSAKARLAKDSCEVELLAKEESAAQAEVDIVRTLMSDIRSEIVRTFHARIHAVGGKEICVDALRQLAAGSGLMDIE